MRRVFVCLLAALLAGVCALAQDVTGTIVGSVLDASGAAIPRAKVVITNTERNAVVRATETDGDGNYAAPQLPVGTYA